MDEVVEDHQGEAVLIHTISFVAFQWKSHVQDERVPRYGEFIRRRFAQTLTVARMRDKYAKALVWLTE